MSVINQMLKDLEQRAPEQGHSPSQTAVPRKTSTLKIVVISTIILLSLNALGFYIWSLQEQIAQNETKPLKETAAVSASVQQIEPKPALKVEEKSIHVNQVSQERLKNSSKIELPETKQVEKVQYLSEQKQNAKVENEIEQNRHQTLESEQSPNTSSPKEKKSLPFLSTKVQKVETIPSSKMSVSRRQLSPEELIERKLAKAEKSISMNEVAKAETLYEDILIIDPHSKEARKKLAALLFGRKSYQQAINLLSQGIALDTNDGDLRLMKARIHLNQRQTEAAYNTLKPLSILENEEYQLLLANTAQQIEQYLSAIGAYQVLIKMQPKSGRWHLGLAIVYDKNSQFSLAANEYAIALSKADLSTSSAKFAQQRMQILGE